MDRAVLTVLGLKRTSGDRQSGRSAFKNGAPVRSKMVPSSAQDRDPKAVSKRLQGVIVEKHPGRGGTVLLGDQHCLDGKVRSVGPKRDRVGSGH